MTPIVEGFAYLLAGLGILLVLGILGILYIPAVITVLGLAENQALTAGTWFYALATLATVFVLILTGLVAVSQLTHLRHDSRRQLVKNLLEQWTGDKLESVKDELYSELKLGAFGTIDYGAKGKDLKEELNSLEKTDYKKFSRLLLIPGYFEMVSDLVRPEEGTQEAREIVKMEGGSVHHYFRLYEAWIKEKRTELKAPDLYIEFEKLRDFAQMVRKEKLSSQRRVCNMNDHDQITS